MTQPPQQPGQPDPDPDATRIRPTGSPRPSHQPATPQPGQPQPAPYGSGQQPKSGRARTLLFVGITVLVLGLLASAVGLLLVTGDSSAEVADLGRGDCLTSASIADGSGDVEDLGVVSCDEAHDAEVVAIGDIDAAQKPADACLQAITDQGTSVAALSIDGREVRPLSTDDKVACLVVGEGLEGSILE